MLNLDVLISVLSILFFSTMAKELELAELIRLSDYRVNYWNHSLLIRFCFIKYIIYKRFPNITFFCIVRFKFWILIFKYLKIITYPVIYYRVQINKSITVFFLFTIISTLVTNCTTDRLTWFFYYNKLILSEVCLMLYMLYIVEITHTYISSM